PTLPSFPTRRSSDLADKSVIAQAVRMSEHSPHRRSLGCSASLFQIPAMFEHERAIPGDTSSTVVVGIDHLDARCVINQVGLYIRSEEHTSELQSREN